MTASPSPQFNISGLACLLCFLHSSSSVSFPDLSPGAGARHGFDNITEPGPEPLWCLNREKLLIVGRLAESGQRLVPVLTVILGRRPIAIAGLRQHQREEMSSELRPADWRA